MSRPGLFEHLAFHSTAAAPLDMPRESVAEIAFAGRSNAGKSSAINALANRNRLAFVSKMPGRTQHINFFSLGGSRFIVDLPGYGYAKVPREVKAYWESLLEGYLTTREQLRGLVLVMDARHPLMPLDVQMLRWFVPSGKPVHALLTKADKLGRQEAAAQLRKVEKTLLNHYGGSAQLFSALSRSGLEQAEAVAHEWLGDEWRGDGPAGGG